MYNLKPKLLAVALLGAGLGTLVLPAQAAAIQEQVKVTSATHLGADEAAAISSAAAQVLRHVAEARAALHRKDGESARTQLGKVDRLLEIIGAALPTATVKDRIWVAKRHLEYEDSEQVLPDLIPIYSSLDEIQDLVPVQQAREHIDKAKQRLQKGDKQAADEELRAGDAALVYTEVDLPLQRTRNRIEAARTALDKGDSQAADTALQQAEDSVVYLSVSVDAPMARARESLWQATRDFTAGAVDSVRRDLAEADRYLHHAAQSMDETTRNTANHLVEELQAVKERLETGGSTVADSLSRLWEESAALAERAESYVDTGWQRLTYQPLGKDDLVEARLHVHFARIDQFTSHDSRQAGSELESALGYLDEAERHVAKTHRDEVKRLRGEVQQLMARVGDVGKSGIPVAQDYDRTIEQMSGLIRTL
ncbi:YfdX family protein [Thioalbus denitrificans]|uniref:YfdX protein n=1 Tax=Thioalbus denitrificans TaxID=547122 RepID=A0A369CDD7_9GAMM|nr:YfdX family protein [Thioalbus denitrificans]RCX31919.1 YfdX protein [Thioalbus denitrificans]